MNVNLGCPKHCRGYQCVDLYPKDSEVTKAEAVEYLKAHPNEFDRIKAYNLIEHLPNVGMFFEASYSALQKHGVLEVRTDNAEWFPFYVPLIHRLSWGAHCSNEYSPAIMNGTKHYCVFTKLHLQHYAELYRFEVLSLRRVTWGARLLAVMRRLD